MMRQPSVFTSNKWSLRLRLSGDAGDGYACKMPFCRRRRRAKARIHICVDIFGAKNGTQKESLITAKSTFGSRFLLLMLLLHSNEFFEYFQFRAIQRECMFTMCMSNERRIQYGCGACARDLWIN